MEEDNEKEDEELDLAVSFSETCSICIGIPESTRNEITKDYNLGLTYKDLCDKWNPKLQEAKIDVLLTPIDLASHFNKHYSVDNVRTTETTDQLFQETLGDLAIIDTAEENNGKNVVDLIEQGNFDVKPVTKGILKSKSIRLKKLYKQLAHDEALTGGMQNIKIHRELTAVEDSMFKTIAALTREFYMDGSGKYDKTLFVVQELARKIFILLNEIEIKWNGESEKLDALKVVMDSLAELFDSYEKEIDTLKPE